MFNEEEQAFIPEIFNGYYRGLASADLRFKLSTNIDAIRLGLTTIEHEFTNEQLRDLYDKISKLTNDQVDVELRPLFDHPDPQVE
jgi:hypothetical protein